MTDRATTTRSTTHRSIPAPTRRVWIALLLAVLIGLSWTVGARAHASQQLLEAVRTGASSERLDALERFAGSRSLRLVAPPMLVEEALDAARRDRDPEVVRRAEGLLARLGGRGAGPGRGRR